MNAELHIAGIVVHTFPDSVPKVAAAIAGLPGVEIHASSPAGKLVVTIEASIACEITARIHDMQQLEAVLSASLVYQHHETLEAMMEEVSHESHQTGLR